MQTHIQQAEPTVVPHNSTHINLMSAREVKFMQKRNDKERIKQLRKEGIQTIGLDYDSRRPDATYLWKAVSALK